MRRVWITCAAIAVLGVSAACTGAPGAEAGDPLGTAADTVNLTMRDLAFDREAIEAEAGQIVEIALANTGSLPHDFTVDRIAADFSLLEPADRVGRGSADLSVLLNPRSETRFQIRVREPGEYVFYCSVAGHRRAGMEGRLVVR